MTKAEAKKILISNRMIGTFALADAIDIAVKALEQEPKTGHWVKEGVVDGNGNRTCRCSECGHRDIQAETQIVPYCWWCGAKMQNNER